MSKIPKHLTKIINSIPEKPGIYQMKDSYGNIIYIGKSKSLKSRVKSYFNTEHKWDKVKRMVFHIQDIEFIVTDTHLEAQVLECALIKKFKPIYNSQFKNHEKYKYLKISNCYRNKPLSIVDERQDNNCIGPYRSKNIINTIMSFFENIYPIARCNNSYDFTYNSLPKPVGKETFEENRNCLVEIFSKKEYMLEFLSSIEKKMNEAAAEFQFERASIYRDTIHSLKYLDNCLLNKNNRKRHRKILMGEKLEEGYKIFYIFNYSIILKRKYNDVTKEAIEEFLAQAKKLEGKKMYIKNEKSDLDFKNIISSELKDITSKVILTVSKKNDIDEFVNKLIKTN